MSKKIDYSDSKSGRRSPRRRWLREVITLADASGLIGIAKEALAGQGDLGGIGDTPEVVKALAEKREERGRPASSPTTRASRRPRPRSSRSSIGGPRRREEITARWWASRPGWRRWRPRSAQASRKGVLRHRRNAGVGARSRKRSSSSTSPRRRASRSVRALLEGSDPAATLRQPPGRLQSCWQSNSGLNSIGR